MGLSTIPMIASYISAFPWYDSHFDRWTPLIIIIAYTTRSQYLYQLCFDRTTSIVVHVHVAFLLLYFLSFFSLIFLSFSFSFCFLCFLPFSVVLTLREYFSHFRPEKWFTLETRVESLLSPAILKLIITINSRSSALFLQFASFWPLSLSSYSNEIRMNEKKNFK